MDQIIPSLALNQDEVRVSAWVEGQRAVGATAHSAWRPREITAHDEQVGSGDFDAMLAVCSRVGALGKILRENPELRAATLPAARLSTGEALSGGRQVGCKLMIRLND